MNKLIIVANFKSHLNNEEAKTWLDSFLQHKDKLQKLDNKEIIISVPFTLLMGFNLAFSSTNFSVAAQDISKFDEGAYTGEVNGKQIKDFAKYVIIGHSERRANFNEIDSVLSEKVELAIKYGLKPIFCIQDENTNIPKAVEVVAYEPVFAIGSGNPDTPENASKVYDSIIKRNEGLSVLYGGSVNSSNVSAFTKGGKLNGVLVGGASLDPLEFIKIIENA